MKFLPPGAILGPANKEIRDIVERNLTIEHSLDGYISATKHIFNHCKKPYAKRSIIIAICAECEKNMNKQLRGATYDAN
jgi:hypothetical protein